MTLQSSPMTPSLKQPPVVKGGLPYLGNALSMRIDPLRYFVNLYKEYGPVFQITVLGVPYTVMAGIDANRFLARQGDEHLGSENLFGGLAREMGSDAMLVALDGPPHRHQRKVQRRAYSREMIQTHLSQVIEITEGFSSQWTPGSVLPLFPTMQRIVTDHLGMLIGGRTCGDYFDDLWVLLNTNMKVHILKSHPKFYLRLPRYVRARERALAFGREVVEWHKANPPVNREPNLVDDLLNAVDENGQPYSEGMILASITGAYFAGMDTVASTASFMLYSVLKVPGLLERIRSEVDEAFASGGLTPEKLRGMDVLHNTAMETLRMYPVAPFTPRTVTKAFDFEGYHFPVGTEVYVANGVPHYLPEFFVNPEVFDVDRYSRPDYQKVPQAFAPFTLGAHTCLGAGMAEVQLMTLIATLVHNVDITLEHPDTDVTIYAMPVPSPGRKFAFKVIGQREPVKV
ncbi:MAG: cytochrome P450 [Anaerolineae bacterium]